MSDARRWLVFGLLVVALPLAYAGVIVHPNEYGLDESASPDCDNPGLVFTFAGPALMIYGAATLINGRRWRRPLNAVVTVLCLLISALLMRNLLLAVGEEQDNRRSGVCEDS